MTDLTPGVPPHDTGVLKHAATEESPEPRPVRTRRIGILVAGLGVVLLARFVVGTLPRVTAARELDAASTADAPPTVEVPRIGRAGTRANLALPGTLEPLQQTALYAR